MLLTSVQRDALTELVNIGFGRAAASLSSLVRQRVYLCAPDVSVYLLPDMQAHLSILEPEVATVHQIFSGQISGDALLILETEGASTLIGLLSDEPTPKVRLTPSDREALMEVGNILLNAFVGSFGNLLKVHVTFAVPRLRLDAIDDLLNTLEVGQQEIRYTLLVQTSFTIAESQVQGFVALVMGIESLDRLFEAMDAAGYQV
ncbi:MAG: chemotaxis protein CheC [Chloroflexota bacterium]